jgi:enoyl-[acyl-carrier protein] reductase I
VSQDTRQRYKVGLLYRIAVRQRRPQPEGIHMGFLNGKKVLITGVASDRSIATGIAEAMKREGAELAFTYQGERLKGRVEEFAAECGSKIVLPLDVTVDQEIDDVFAELKKQWGVLDGLVHSIGFAPREQLQGKYLDAVTREGYRISHDISAYSFLFLNLHTTKNLFVLF